MHCFVIRWCVRACVGLTVHMFTISRSFHETTQHMVLAVRRALVGRLRARAPERLLHVRLTTPAPHNNDLCPTVTSLMGTFRQIVK